MKLNLTPYDRAPEQKNRFNFSAFICDQVMRKKSPIMVMPYTKVAVYTTLREHIARKQYPIYLMKVGNQMLFLRTDLDVPEVALPTPEQRGIVNESSEEEEMLDVLDNGTINKHYETEEVPVSQYDHDEEDGDVDEDLDDIVEEVVIPKTVTRKSGHAKRVPAKKAAPKKVPPKPVTPQTLKDTYTAKQQAQGKAVEQAVASIRSVADSKGKGPSAKRVARISASMNITPASDAMS